MYVSSVRLRREPPDLVVEIETDDEWMEVIRERDDGQTPHCHIVEDSGLLAARDRRRGGRRRFLDRAG